VLIVLLPDVSGPLGSHCPLRDRAASAAELIRPVRPRRSAHRPRVPSLIPPTRPRPRQARPRLRLGSACTQAAPATQFPWLGPHRVYNSSGSVHHSSRISRKRHPAVPRAPVGTLRCPFPTQNSIASVHKIGGWRDGSRPEVVTTLRGQLCGRSPGSSRPGPRTTRARSRSPWRAATAERKPSYPSTRRGSRQGKTPGVLGVPGGPGSRGGPGDDNVNNIAPR
jgi:hypothetical protein